MSSDDDINRLAGLCALFGEDSDGDGDRSMDASFHQAQETSSVRTPTTEELLDMSTEPLPEDNPDAERDAEGEGLAALSGSDIPNPQADGDEAEGEYSDGRDDHRGSEEDEIPSPPESVTMVDLEVEMDAALVKCQKFLDKAWEQQELYKKLRRSYQRGSRAKALKKGKGDAVAVVDPVEEDCSKIQERDKPQKAPDECWETSQVRACSHQG